ncbi:hypothetical protein FNL55_06595 [Tardiphaga sp. vice352]|uniref:hypothetical protein n=1 Tax=unclassified Tardiphaga TaxID=2631404 RepID=UPI00116271E7|nr:MULTISPECIES: hypothetical protein [unclassified Tardiphaga]MBC7582494.1 hypothetical protein [Tardiphaga sp.]QDM15614.1 hypothetical protein FNL53_06535 [Tardiphaga sp. vice278]QDM20678.1 hypothetical protein FIU28_05700 [Tardiphaga sp. vice154]QDM25812.1 hypothetical protein FNL56_06580 [Tardiphaga sp. vice304]QDM31014.1 hypothetical protein FNL55_06595 [Tardiphaga sp. vice352]
MFEHFPRFRAQHYLRGMIGEREFKARSASRDAETDSGRVHAILLAIEQALTGAEKEHAGLTRRVDDVLSRAAVTFGNGNDEYLTREPLDSDHLDLLEKEISNGQRRLRELVEGIANYKSMRTVLLSRFAEHEPQRSGTAPTSI